MKSIEQLIKESVSNDLWHNGDELPEDSKITDNNRGRNKMTTILLIQGGKVNNRKVNKYENVVIATYFNDGEYTFGSSDRKKLESADKWCYLDDILPKK